MRNDKKKENQYRVNEQIRAREVRVVSDGESSVMPLRQALDLARQEGVDLVEISPNAQPPVCRLIDYSKFLYQQKKRQKEMKAKQVKQVQPQCRCMSLRYMRFATPSTPYRSRTVQACSPMPTE